jgi:ATP-binding cassette, subfamily B, bacterial
MNRPRSSRQRYLSFVQDYKRRRLDDTDDGAGPQQPQKRAKRREYLYEYLRWLRPHAFTVGGLLLLALGGAGLEMVEPLFMRYIVDRVLLIAGLDAATRIARLNFAGALFLTLVVASNFIGALRDYR